MTTTRKNGSPVKRNGEPMAWYAYWIPEEHAWRVPAGRNFYVGWPQPITVRCVMCGKEMEVTYRQPRFVVPDPELVIASDIIHMENML
jgi:hypothetical protein